MKEPDIFGATIATVTISRATILGGIVLRSTIFRSIDR